MGIKGLSKLLADEAPQCRSENAITAYFGRRVAIDASTCLYQFLVSVRSEGQQLMSESGETTSHVVGMFYRTIRMLENGIRPVYVFDGKPPMLKSGELAKRHERRREAKEGLERAEEDGDAEKIDKFSRRIVKVTDDHVRDVKRLLDLMGIPYITAPCEAEAQCAALAKSGLVYAAGSEDMDTLTFGAPRMLRHLTFSEARKEPIIEYNTDDLLKALNLSQDEFIDLCILCGCDYAESITGVGPKTAYNLIKKHRSIENVLGHIDKAKVPENWPYEDARVLFKEPDVNECTEADLKWTDPNEDGLIQYMVHEMSFNEDRVRSGIKKMLKCKGVASQKRLSDFFKVIPAQKKAKIETKKPKRKK